MLIPKVLIHLFYVFGREACWILVPPLGIEPGSLAVKAQSPNSGLPGKSLSRCLEISGEGGGKRALLMDFPGGLVVKNPPDSARDIGLIHVWEDSTCHVTTKLIPHTTDSTCSRGLDWQQEKPW